jgi:hypothetical protein
MLLLLLLLLLLYVVCSWLVGGLWRGGCVQVRSVRGGGDCALEVGSWACRGGGD